jgi:hypothetical protein
LTGVRACVRVGFQSHISRTGGPAGQHARTHAGHSLTPTGSRPSVRATIPFVTTDCNCSSISNSEFRHPTLLYPFSRKSLALLYSDRSMSSPLPTNATYREIKWSKRAYLFFIQRDRCTSIFMILSFPCCKGKQRGVCLISSRWTSGYKHRVDTYFNTCYSATTVAYQVSTLTGAYIHTYYIVINRELIQ